MFTKILIANRGEIACRVIGTARRLGVAHRRGLFRRRRATPAIVALADEAVHIGPAPASESYLRGDADHRGGAARPAPRRSIPATASCPRTPTSSRPVEAAGLVFIGPSAAAIRAMGLKDAAKALMAEAGVPVVPGYHGERPGRRLPRRARPTRSAIRC